MLIGWRFNLTGAGDGACGGSQNDHRQTYTQGHAATGIYRLDRRTRAALDRPDGTPCPCPARTEACALVRYIHVPREGLSPALRRWLFPSVCISGWDAAAGVRLIMRILHTEQLGGLTLTIGQEWAGAGLYWQLDCPADRAWPLPRYHHQSSGRFYPDQAGEQIHGKDLDAVVQTAIIAAKRFCGAA